MSKELSPEQRQIAIKWKAEINKGIKDKEVRAEELKEKIEEFKFKIDIFRRIRGLIKDEMSKRKESIHPQRLEQCLDKVDEEKGSLEEQLEKTREERLNLEIELIIGRQELFFLKKDLEEKSG